mmetsp:Transcript_30786/g.42890  ORF Transcript_30786/g.42890 Transcript_30786/m.42890 type:complete len:93 (+) Transcript_30786:210-488(+)
MRTGFRLFPVWTRTTRTMPRSDHDFYLSLFRCSYCDFYYQPCADGAWVNETVTLNLMGNASCSSIYCYFPHPMTAALLSATPDKIRPVCESS